MNVKEAVEILERRRKFLEERSDLSYDRAEASALEMAVLALRSSAGKEAHKIVVEEKAGRKEITRTLLEIYYTVKDGSSLSRYTRFGDGETVIRRLERILTKAGAIETAQV